MGVFNGQYPRDLEKVIGHAKRLMKVLSEMERARSDVWLLGRATELRGVVSLAVSDWRSGARDVDTAERAIVSYIDTLHRGASRKLRCGLALACCEIDEVITAVAPDEWRSTATVEAHSAAVSQKTNGPTDAAAWADSPEMVARFHEGLPLIERTARMVARRVGPGGATVDDLHAFGREGLLDAARAFDEARGVPFDQWATLRIRSAMIDGARRWGTIPQRERRRVQAIEGAPPSERDTGEANRARRGEVERGAAMRWVPLDAEGEIPAAAGGGGDDARLTPEELLTKAQLAAVVRAIVAKLPNPERALIERSYFHGQTLDQAAASIGVTRSWASRVHARAIKTLERELRKREAEAGGKAWEPGES